MKKQESTGTDLGSLMEALEGKEGMSRQKARESLVTLGNRAVPSLANALQNCELKQVRWEAAKALRAILEAKSIPQLVNALEDSESDVAWLAAEALTEFKKVAWPELMRALVERGPQSITLRRGAHHVLGKQKEDGFDDLLISLREALESTNDPGSLTIPADALLDRMQAKA